MSARRMHYNPTLPEGDPVYENRVAGCGAITWHSEPQRYVLESRHPEDVTCRYCLRNPEVREYLEKLPR